MRTLMVNADVPHSQLGGLGKHVPALVNEPNRPRHAVDLLGNANNAVGELPEKVFPGLLSALFCRDFVLRHAHHIALRSFASARYGEGTAE